MLASGMGSLPISKFGQKNTLVGGNAIVTICLFGIMGCFLAESPIGIIAFNVVYVIAFQCSLGPIGYNHAVETCLPFTVGPLNAFLFANVILTSSLGPILNSTLGPAYTFVFFGSISFFFTIYSAIFVKNTSFVDEVIDEDESPETPGVVSIN